MIRTILTAVDGSDHARKAVDLAIELAEKFGARVVVVHAIGQGTVPEGLIHMAEVEHIVEPQRAETSVPGPGVLHAEPQRYEDSARIHAYIGNKLISEFEEAAKEKNFENYKTVAVEGDPAQRILETANAEGADMIVMGSRGMGNLKGLLVGSVSNKVNHLAECTCVLVK